MSTKTFPGQKPDRLLIFLVLSVAIHMAALGLFTLLPHGGQGAHKAKRPIPVEVVPLKPERKAMDVVESSPAQRDNVSPVKKEPTHYSDRDQSVKKETWPEPSPVRRPRALPPVARGGHEGSPGGSSQKAEAKGGSSAAPGAAPPAVSRGEELRPVEEPVRAQEAPKASGPSPEELRGEPGAMPRIKTEEPRRPSLFPTDDRIAELTRKYETEAPKGEIGKTLQLNTSELKYQRYLIDMKRKIEFYWDYPELASRNGWQGSLKLSFRINRDGTVTDILLERSSGYPSLDDAAITALRLASPFPPFPANFDIKDLNIKGQFIYQITAQPARR